MIFTYIIVGNLSQQVVNIIDYQKLIFNFRQIIVPTITWAILGMYISTRLWKKNEKAYDYYIKIS